MIRPILACDDPYAAAELLSRAGWHTDFSQPPESGDPLVGMSLLGNALLLGVTSGYVDTAALPHRGAGVVLYLDIPSQNIRQVYENHRFLNPSKLQTQSWKDVAFEFHIEHYKIIVAAKQD